MKKLRDEDTDELHYVGIVKKARHKEAFTMVFTEPLAELLGTFSLSKMEMRVFLYLVAMVQYENWVDLSIAEISEALDHDRSTVSKVLPALESLDLIYREAAQGNRPRRILLDPHLVFRGGPAQRAAMMKRGWPPVPSAPLERSDEESD